MDEQLRHAIRDSGLSLNELGRRAGLDHSRLSRYMRGERDLTLSAVAKLCEVLGLQLSKPMSDTAPAADTISDNAGKHDSTVNTKPKKDVPTREGRRS